MDGLTLLGWIAGLTAVYTAWLWAVRDTERHR